VQVRWFPTTALPELQHEADAAERAMARATVAPPAPPLLRSLDLAAEE
jgi:hypothetical protein